LVSGIALLVRRRDALTSQPLNSLLARENLVFVSVFLLLLLTLVVIPVLYYTTLYKKFQ